MPFRLAFAVTEAGPEAAAGDYFTALELGTALQARFGWHIEYRSKNDEGEGWYDLAGIDLLVVMVEEYELPAIRNASLHLVTIAWARNWFERWCYHPWVADYDLHLASSRQAADFMSQRTGKLARLLRIATNPGRFNTDGRPARPTLDYVFTGHYWQAERDIVDALSALPTHYRGAIYGKNWEQVPALAHLHRGFVPYGQIHEVYRQATIVIDDANHVTKEWGAANSRVFDALAAGCLVITNSQSVSDDAFDGRLPVYESPEGLANLLERYLNNEDERSHLLDELRGMVLARHCYAHRAMELGVHLRSLRKQGIDFVAATSVRESTLPAPAAEESPQRQPDHAMPKHRPFVSFVVPLFNHLAETREMLASLQASLPEGLDYEIILADDASTDGTASWLKTLRDPRIKVLISETNRGYAANNNAGVRLATGQLLGLLNNDLLFEPGWLEPMLAVLLSPDLKAGLVGNVQYRVADGAVDHAGVRMNRDGELEHIRTLPATDTAYTPAFAVTGACVLLRKADFEAVGGFDTAYRNGAEDIDLCFKLRRLGRDIVVANQSRIRHHVSLSRGPASLNDIRNSRVLYTAWRKEIKRKLSIVWRDLLAQAPAAYADTLEGALDPNFGASPLTAWRVAEAILQRQAARWAWLLEGGQKPAEDLERLSLDALPAAGLCFRHRFEIDLTFYGDEVKWSFRDRLSPRTARIIDEEPDLASREGHLAALRLLLPPCIPLAPRLVREHPESDADAHFWQFPAITERLAFDNHAALPLPPWQPKFSGPVQAYLGLPWATYIDKQTTPEDVRQVFRTRLHGYRALATEWGLAWGEDVRIHTICQHIYWARLLPLWAELGITDIHLSHCEPKSADIASKYGLRVHSWPLAAANVVNPERREGLAIGKPIAERKRLASFIGAHMAHYRSEIRLRLQDEIQRAGAQDVLYELRDDWHFNPQVYDAQVRGKVLTAEDHTRERVAMIRYNELLSDSIFALCPEGAGPNTIRLWEALAVGAIPVVFVEDWIWPEVPGGNWDSAVICLRRDEVTGIIERLRRLRQTELDRLVRMQQTGMGLYEKFAKLRCFEG